MTVQEIFELRKSGRIEEAYTSILPLYKFHHGHYTTLCMFWTAADIAIVRIESGNLSEAIKIMKSLRNIYPQIDDKDKSAKRKLLNIALKLFDKQKNTFKDNKESVLKFSLFEFIEWWDMKNLTVEDWRAQKIDNHYIQPFALKIISRLFSELTLTPQNNNTDNIKKLLLYIDEGLKFNPSQKNLLRYKAQVLIKLNDKEAASSIYKSLISKSREPYVFSEYADLVEDPAEQIALLVKSLLMQSQEQFRQKTRLKLAFLMADVRPQYAKYELEQCVRFRQSMGYKNNRDIMNLVAKLSKVQAATKQEQANFYSQVLDYYITHIENKEKLP